MFLLILATLIIFTQMMTTRVNAFGGGVPVLQWATYAHPSREAQAALFRQWLKKKGYPDIIVKNDGANQGTQKFIIQGVTGVASDVFDVMGNDVQYLHSIGLLRDLTGVFATFGMPTNNYYPGLVDELFVDGKRIAYSGNVGTGMYWVNPALFRRFGMAPPPSRLDWATFEAVGKEFTRRANGNNKRFDYFFAGSYNKETLWHSAGVSWYNETLTATGLRNPRAVEVAKLIMKWTVEDHLFPTGAEMASFNISQGVGGPIFQLFYHGKFALMYTGVWALMQVRTMGAPMELDAMESPHGGYPTSDLHGRVEAIYKGSKQSKAAEHFIAFLGSEDYNLSIIEAGDSSPPDPKYLTHLEFVTPKGYTNEWRLRQGFVRTQQEIAQGREYSPFLSYVTARRLDNTEFGSFQSRLQSAEDTMAHIADGMDREIQKTINRRPELKERWRKAVERQKAIDALKAQGKKVPLDWIDNTFLRRYYRDNGLGV